MNDNILYYPAISLPKNEWTIKSTLYWNEVGVIVPYEYIENPNLYEGDMKEMVRANLVRQIISNEYTSKQYRISNSIIGVIKSPIFDLAARQENFKKGNTWKIHNQKFRPDLFKLLLTLEIASKFPDEYKYNWYFVEEKTASIMMTYLAGTISKDVGFTPATDNEEYIKEIDHSSIVENDMSKIRSQILEEVMPYPTNVNFSSLMNFKEKYSDQLLDFRRLVESTCLSVLAMPNEESRNRLLQIELKKIEAGKNELIARLKEGRLGKIAMGTFKGMVVDGAISVLTGDIISPAATLIGGINEVINEYNGNPIKDDDLAYLALIDQRLK